MLIQILILIGLLLLLGFSLRIYRKKKTKPNEEFWNVHEWLESIGGTGGIATLALSLLIAFVSGKSINDINSSVNGLQETSEQLSLQGRTTISDFIQCKFRAEKMIEEVDSKTESEVKVAIFWPMFGADTGDDFKEYLNGKRNDINFHSLSENEFYYYLFRRFDNNMPTHLIFLNYDSLETDKSPMRRFIEALAEYEIPTPNGVKKNFPVNKSDKIEKEILKHINTELIPVMKNYNNKCHIRLINNLPILLFITDDKTEKSVTNKKALLFLGNIEMLEKQSPQGGFYTENEGMVDILIGLFNSLYNSSFEIKK